MSDAVESGLWALGGALAGKAIDALVKLVGSRKERAEAESEEAAPTERAAELALRMADRADEDTRRVRGERDDCQAQLREVREQADRDREQAARDRARLAAVEMALEEHARCAPRIAELEHEVAYLREEQRLSRGMLGDLMRHQTTPPEGIHVDDETRRAVAAQET